MDELETCNLYTFKPFRFEYVNIHPASTSASIPSPRSGHRIICTGKYMYLYGGYNTNIGPTICSDVWRFNIATRKWYRFAEGQNIPVEAASVAAFRRKEDILIYGGTGVPFGYKVSNSLHSIKLIGGNIIKYEIAGDSPPPMYGQAMVLQKNLLYVIGGTDGFAYTCEIHRVNLKKHRKVWKQIYKASPKIQENGEILPYEPEGRHRHEVAFDGKNIFIIGGGTAGTAYNLIDIPVFNIPSKTWQRISSIGDPNADPPYPRARKCHGLVQLKSGNKRYVFVSCGLADESVLNDLWMLDLSTLQWTLINNAVFPTGIYFHSTSLTYRNKLYLFGGIKHEGLKMQRLNGTYCAWMCIPKLSEICWEAVLHYIGYKDVSKALLRQLRVPKCFIQRVD